MEIIKTPIEGLLVIKPDVFTDERGYFFESFNKEKMAAVGIVDEFVQDNQSLSKKNVLRGLHFQNPPYAQGKLIRVIKGAVLDVAVDLRKKSSTFGQHYKIELNEDNKLLFWIPVGFAHGFLSLADDTIFFYKCTNFYNKKSEGSLHWNDPILKIDWGVSEPIVAAKDAAAGFFKDFKSHF